MYKTKKRSFNAQIDNIDNYFLSLKISYANTKNKFEFQKKINTKNFKNEINLLLNLLEKRKRFENLLFVEKYFICS